MTTIPASAIVAVNPSVLKAGGDALDLIGLVLSTSTRVPIGTVSSFPDQISVADFFGATSTEAQIATNYFLGFDNSTAKPGSILYAQYPTSAVSAYLRGGVISGLTLTQLQAINGLLAIAIDGAVKSANINLAPATSFSNAASIIGNALSIEGPQVATINAQISGTTLSVGTLTTGALSVGDIISGTGVTVGTYITSQLTGTPGGVGTYVVSSNQTALPAAMTVFAPAVTYDSISGAYVVTSSTTGPTSSLAYGSGAAATSLKLTALTGAVLSQGTNAATPSAFMDSITNITQDLATFMLAFDPDNGSGNAQKLLFAEWVNGTNDRYVFVCWDTDTTPAASNSAPTSLGALITAADLSGTELIWVGGSSLNPIASMAAFQCGAIASIDFTATNGRATMAFRSQTGLFADVTDQITADNLRANGYNYYGAYATANEGFTFFYPGSISGPFDWVDSYVNQIWLNSNFQLALMTLLTQTNSIPYNPAGNAQIESALADPINAGVNFGAIRAGVILSASQIAAVNAQAGANIAPTLNQRGWYLQILPASPTVRQQRGSPPATFWYMDGEAVQQITLSSVVLQ